MGDTKYAKLLKCFRKRKLSGSDTKSANKESLHAIQIQNQPDTDTQASVHR